MDQAGYACAANWSAHYFVTVSIGEIRFISPILVGQMVTLNAQKIHTDKISMHIYIQIVAGDPKQNKMVKTGHCIMVFVASDQTDYPLEVPSWQPQTK
jgi:acyl-CoA hydrolase